MVRVLPQPHEALDLDHVLVSDPGGDFGDLWVGLGFAYHLDDARVVTKVKELKASHVAVAVHPATESHRRQREAVRLL